MNSFHLINMRIRTGEIKPVFCLFIISVISGLAINAGDTTLAPRFVKTLFIVLCYLLSLTCIISIINNNAISRARYSTYILFSVFCFWLMGVVNTAPGVNPQYAPLFVLEMLAFALASDNVKREAFALYKWALVAMSIAGLLVVFSFFIYPILPHRIIPYYGENVVDTFYYDYTISYLYVDSMDGIRLCGLFNEPGYFGTMLALTLVSERCNIRKPEVCIMMLAGFFTFSAAFFVTLGIYFITKYLNRPQYLIIVFILLFSFFYILPTLDFEDRMLDTLVKRLSIEDGQLAGDNRDRVNTTALMNTFNNSNDIFFGRGVGSTKELGVSFLMIIIQLGYIGTLLTYGSLICAGWKFTRKNWDSIVFLLCFTANIYQRTNVYCMNYFLVLFGGILYVNSLSEKTRKSSIQRKN